MRRKGMIWRKVRYRQSEQQVRMLGGRNVCGFFQTQEGAVALNYKAWQRGAIGVEEHHLHRKQCDWCPLELCHESAHARTLAWLE